MSAARPSATPTRMRQPSRTTFPPIWRARHEQKRSFLLKDRPGFRTIALRPPALWGPGYPFSRALPDVIKSGRFSFVDRGDYPFSTCHVDNVVEAEECALERGEGGRADFIKDQEELTFREFVAGLAGVQGLSIEKLRSMPYWLVSTVGRMFDTFWAVARQEGDPPISPR